MEAPFSWTQIQSPHRMLFPAASVKAAFLFGSILQSHSLNTGLLPDKSFGWKLFAWRNVVSKGEQQQWPFLACRCDTEGPLEGRFDFPGRVLRAKSTWCLGGHKRKFRLKCSDTVTRDPHDTSLFCKSVKIVVLNPECHAPIFTVSCSATPYFKPWSTILAHTQ